MLSCLQGFVLLRLQCSHGAMTDSSPPPASQSTSTQPSPPASSPPPVLSKVQRALRAIADDVFNLASENLVSHVRWMETGTGVDVLVEQIGSGSDDDGDDASPLPECITAAA